MCRAAVRDMIPAHVFLERPAAEVTPAAEEEFFTSLRMRNGTYKTTSSRRFSAIDRELRDMVQAGRLCADRVLDVAVSSGVSTLELYEALDGIGRRIEIVATDLMSEGRLVRVFPACYTLADDTGFPLRHDFFRWTMTPWVVGSDYRTGFFLVRKGVNLMFSRRARGLMRHGASPRVKHVELVTPRLRAVPRIRVRNDDVTSYNPGFAGRFDFIRAANILNKAYFTRDRLRSALDNLRRYLAGRGSSLLVVRTHQDGGNHGTLFRVGSTGGCEILQRFGDGSEIEDLALEVMSIRVHENQDAGAGSGAQPCGLDT